MLKWSTLSVFIIIMDQISKIWADNNLIKYQENAVLALPFDSGLNFTLAYNTGAAYSLMDNMGGIQHFIFASLAIAVSVYIIYSLWKMPKHELQQSIALSLVLGGAIGNLIDRVLYQHVIDFISLYVNKMYLFGIFNIADIAISAGALLLILDMFHLRVFRSKHVETE